MRHERAFLSEDDGEEKLEGFVADVRRDGYGRDPNLKYPIVPWELILTQYEVEQLTRLSDIILPGDDSNPWPHEVGIGRFMNEWLSAPYKTQREHREIVVRGLLALDDSSVEAYSRRFLELEDVGQLAMVETMSKDDAEQIFFRTVRYLVLAGYYTSDAGARSLGYVGNVPRSEFPKVDEVTSARVEDELRKLGL